MNLNPNDLPEHIKKLNPHLFGPLGAVESPQQKPDTRRALGADAQTPATSHSRVATGGPVLRVTLIGFEHRRRDSDNPCFKALRDAIAREFGLDDDDRTIAWEYGSALTSGAEGTLVRIEVL